jgi:glycosyltransferase involved in cell wall biosynthesis
MRLRRLLHASRPHVVHAWGPLANIYSCLASPRAVTSVVASLRDVERELNLTEHLLRPWLSNRACELVVNADYLSQQRLPITPRNVRVIANGIGQAAPPAASSLQSQLGVSSETLLIGCVGDVVAKKRLPELIWALDLLRVIRPHVNLVIVGSGEMEEDVRQYASRISDPRAVHFLGHRDDTAELISQFFCLWQASEREGCSNAILEAMALGVPVIASDTAGHRSLIRHNDNGLLVSLGDCAEFARRANVLMADRDTADGLAERAKSFVESNFSIDRMIREFGCLYNDVASRPLGQPA